MITRILVTGVAIAALTAGAASAHKARHHARHGGLTFAAPEQPIPYAELDHYLRASPAERRSIAAAASTGGAANASATTSDTTTAPAPANPPAATPDNSAVNPPPSTMGGATGASSANDATQPHTQPK